MVLSQPARRILFAALLLLFLGRVALTWRVFNDTMDEPDHISAGLELLDTGRYTYEPEHPPLARLLIAAFASLGGLHYHPVLWAHDSPWSTHDLDFYWKTLSLARAANLLFAVLLFFIVWRWSQLLHGSDAALAACALLVCCPNLLALAGIATLDFAAAVAIVASAFFLWRWSQEPGWRRAVVSGIVGGLAVLTKFSSLVLLPPLALLYFALARRFPLKQLLAAMALGALVIWAGYRFETGAIAPAGHNFRSKYPEGQSAGLPRLLTRFLQHKSLPAPLFFHGLIDIASHNRTGHNAYLLGRTRQYGWWYYFPVAVLLKTTIPLLVLVGLGTVRRPHAVPLLTVVLIVGVAMAGNLNIGIRHILAIYPFFTLLAAPLFAHPGRLRVIALLLLVWHAVESFRAHPDYLAYFNQWARGREHRYLADSNLDWGQDLARLAQYARDHQLGPIQLSYFGQADPAKFGLAARKLHWTNPDPGWIAISVNHLVGIQNDPGPARWLWHLEPRAKVGKSIWLFYLEK